MRAGASRQPKTSGNDRIGVNDMRVVIDAKHPAVSGSTVSFICRALLHIGVDETMQRCWEKVFDFSKTNALTAVAFDLDHARARDEHFTLATTATRLGSGYGAAQLGSEQLRRFVAHAPQP